jgi:non-heme chloroperoxidase
MCCKEQCSSREELVAQHASVASYERSISDKERAQVDRANQSGKQPVVFVHGLWLLPNSWDPWADLFEAAGYCALQPGWPDDPETFADARAHPEVFARKSVGQIVDHYRAVIRQLDRKPAVIGHSFGGLFAQMLAGRGLAAVSVAIDPAQCRGVLALPISVLKSAWPVLYNPLNTRRTVLLTYEQFRYVFANALDEDEAKTLYDTCSVPGPGKPIFQAAAANLNPWTEVKVEVKNPDRGPLLIVSGGRDHTVPPAIARAAYKRQRRNVGTTEFVEFAGRGHSLTIDHGWRDVADSALGFVKQYV